METYLINYTIRREQFGLSGLACENGFEGTA
jgi:hypothetical protein